MTKGKHILPARFFIEILWTPRLFVPLYLNITKQKINYCFSLDSSPLKRNQWSVNLVLFHDEIKNKRPVFNCLVLRHVYGFFILCTHFLQSWSVNTANQHNYHLLLHFHQKIGIVGLYNLDYVLIFFQC